ncbi:hypothetical protein [Pseudomonas aeruginosa]|uniref:hypothetical protein n=1 Tax=Pseudomonas aeruginosa TaxID=287 RepID=UPI0019649857|nr:hypothetical protein [Pseudomonas aeruginosa]
MTESKICTCPSGDGSLRWPCPAHPAEQAGGDERAAFEAAFAAMGRPVCRADYDHAAYGTPFDDGGWTGWQARAALAQPSLDHAVQAHDIPMLIASEHANPDYAMGWNDCRAKIIGASSAAQAEQAEAERPEVVARVVHSNPVVLGQCGPLNANDELMTVAQHAASVARWAEMFNRVEQQRDAALARVAELEKQEPVATVAKVPGEDWNSLDFHRDLQDMQPGTKLYAAPVAQAQQLHDLDKQCRDDVARALGLRPNQERGFAWSYLLASIKSCVKASEDSAQAQHSVPIAPELKRALGLVVAALEADGDRPTSKYALSELKKVLAAAPVCRLSRSALTDAQMRRLYDSSTETENERLGFEAFARLIRRAEAVHQIAAAPGKEVGHE